MRCVGGGGMPIQGSEYSGIRSQPHKDRKISQFYKQYKYMLRITNLEGNVLIGLLQGWQRHDLILS